MALLGVTMGEMEAGSRALVLDTTAGPMAARYFPVEGARQGIVLLDDTDPVLWQSQGVCAVVPRDGIMGGLVCAQLLLDQGLGVLAWGPGAETIVGVLPQVELA